MYEPIKEDERIPQGPPRARKGAGARAFARRADAHPTFMPGGAMGRCSDGSAASVVSPGAYPARMSFSTSRALVARIQYKAWSGYRSTLKEPTNLGAHTC